MDAIVSFEFDKCIKALNNYDIRSAQEHLQKARALLSCISKNSIQWAIYYLNLSSVHNNSGRFQESINSCAEAGKVLKYNRHKQLTAKLACNMASDYAGAQKNIQKAISLYQKEKQKEALADALLTLGQILLRKGDWLGAFKKCSKALLLARQSENRRMVGDALIRLGYIFRADPVIFQEGGYLHLAIDHFRQAENYFKDVEYRPGIVEALYERATTCISLNMLEKTRELKKRIEGMTHPGSPMRFFLLNLSYCLHNREGQFQDAISDAKQLHEFHDQAGDKKGVADSLEKLGSAYFNLRDMDQARKYEQEALYLATKIGDELIKTKSRQMLLNIEKPSMST